MTRFSRRVLGLLFVGFVTCASATQLDSPSVGTLRMFLQMYLRGHDVSTRFSFATAQLTRGPRQQIFVYVAGRMWCGSGGCTALLLEPLGSSFKVVDRFTLARLPIRILPSMTNGWRDIAMEVRGGGIHPRRAVVLKFNGRKYPSNPSMAPELNSSRADQEGMTLLLDEQGNLLYP